MSEEARHILDHAGVKPTSNRMLVLKALLSAKSPVSLIELETQLETLERSSISRVLSLFMEHDVIHAMEDGRGIVRYEICTGKDCCTVGDMHAHFYCEVCQRVYCFEEISAPIIDIPPTFEVRTVNYMLKGICPECRRAGHHL